MSQLYRLLKNSLNLAFWSFFAFAKVDGSTGAASIAAIIRL